MLRWFAIPKNGFHKMSFMDQLNNSFNRLETH
jgi:hypothetical protein